MEVLIDKVSIKENHLHQNILRDSANRDKVKHSKYLLNPVRIIICFTNNIIKMLMEKISKTSGMLSKKIHQNILKTDVLHLHK